jgi:hypothetical protein
LRNPFHAIIDNGNADGSALVRKNMKASDLFGVVVRATGFLIIIYSLWNVWTGFDNVFENILQINQGSDAEAPSTISYFVFGLPGLALGAVFFFLADWIVKLAYRGAS